MGAKLAALIRIKPALKQRPENGRIDVAPVQARGFQNEGDIFLVEGNAEQVGTERGSLSARLSIPPSE
jgi:hypothetical protein